ncbi:MAG: hypothetical protein H6Q14_2775 [Bacteroidetes bacterium]|nr:hypothetical protein [Bacteroidota bacterium]
MITFNNDSLSVIGDEWVYYKIYTGESFIDKLLSNILVASKQLYKEGIIDKWFFIRYYDPRFHIRLRFHLTNSKKIQYVIELMNVSLSEYLIEGLIDNVQIDSYIKENERYGGKVGCALSEYIFFADSVMMCEFSSLLGQNKEEERWLFALINMDNLMNDFSLSIETRLIFLGNLIDYFHVDFLKNKYLSKQFDAKFRDHLREIKMFLDNDKSNIFEYLVNIRRKMYNQIILEILNGIKDETIHKSVFDLLSSYMHMSCNRLFRTEHRRNEFVLYNILLRFYKYRLYSK